MHWAAGSQGRRGLQRHVVRRSVLQAAGLHRVELVLASRLQDGPGGVLLDRRRRPQQRLQARRRSEASLTLDLAALKCPRFEARRRSELFNRIRVGHSVKVASYQFFQPIDYSWTDLIVKKLQIFLVLA